MAEADAALRAAKDRERLLKQDVIRVRALHECEQASNADVRAAEDAAVRASEDRREAEDRLETCVATLPALAAAYDDTIEAYRVERPPGVRTESAQKLERIDRAWAELLAAFEAGAPLAEELRRDFTVAQTATGYTCLDGRLPYNLEGLLGGFFVKNKIGLLAEKWKSARARG